MNNIALELKNKKILISLLLTTSEKSSQQGFIAELYLFFTHYSFLLDKATELKNSCVVKTSKLSAPQGNEAR
ncbi:MAG: hypothetical protein IKR40_01160 [Treponema sp.]|nr:hypothetical protein [Treponema sp.]